ncbi:MAG TPA: hypothetical protein DEV97_05505, partial [Lachnospiraceae bacterium]|nr:hypothetical protein [Lachnospiraceae bacterium]
MQRLADVPDGVQHHPAAFSREPQDQMSHDPDSPFMEPDNCVIVVGQRMAKIHGAGGLVMDGL